MDEQELSAMTDEALLEEAKKLKRNEVFSALTIGVMIGVIVFSMIKKTLGLFTLIPLYFVYKMLRNSKNNDALKRILKERNLN